MQVPITISVIDTPLRIPQSGGMLDHDEILRELVRQLDTGKVKAKDVAVKLKIAPARVTEMRQGNRRIQSGEMATLAGYLGMTQGSFPMTTQIRQTIDIPDYGKVAQGVWLEQTYADPDNPEFVPYDMRDGDPGPGDLFAVTPEGASMNLAFKQGTRLICRKIPFGTGAYKPGNYVIAQRTAHDLYEMTVKRLEVDDEGVYWLHSESDQPQFKQPWRIGRPDDGHHQDDEISILGKVVREVVIYE